MLFIFSEVCGHFLFSRFSESQARRGRCQPRLLEWPAFVRGRNPGICGPWVAEYEATCVIVCVELSPCKLSCSFAFTSLALVTTRANGANWRPAACARGPNWRHKHARAQWEFAARRTGYFFKKVKKNKQIPIHWMRKVIILFIKKIYPCPYFQSTWLHSLKKTSTCLCARIHYH
jgi:hypothetical protein